MTTSLEGSAAVACLTGKSVLVAEDNAIIGMFIEDLLWEAGCIVLGPVVSVIDALAVLQAQRPDAALLDHTLADGTVAPVAAALTARGVPFALLTAAEDLELSDGLTFTPRVTKPFGTDAIQQMLRDLLDGSSKLGQQLQPARGWLRAHPDCGGVFDHAGDRVGVVVLADHAKRRIPGM